MTTRRIVPAEADEDMMLAGMDSADRMASATQGDAIIACYTAMLAASPASGKVTKEEVRNLAAILYPEVFSRKPKYEETRIHGKRGARLLEDGEDAFRDIDDALAKTRAALASLGMEVG